MKSIYYLIIILFFITKCTSSVEVKKVSNQNDTIVYNGSVIRFLPANSKDYPNIKLIESLTEDSTLVNDDTLHVRQKGSSLAFYLQNGDSLFLKSNDSVETDDYLKHVYIEKIKNKNFWLIQNIYYDG